MTKAETIDQETAKPAVPGQEEETPILQLFRKHRALNKAADAFAVAVAPSNEEMERLFTKELDAIEAEMMALPSTCAADFAAKVIVDTREGEMFSEWETGDLWKEARRLTEQGATGAQHESDTASGHGPEERVRLIAEALETKAPDRLLDDDGAPSQEVLDFCKATGASLDYIFCGDLKPMFRRQYHSAQQERGLRIVREPTSLPEVYIEWKALRENIDARRDLSDEELADGVKELNRLTDLAMEWEPTSVHDMAIKIAIGDDGGDMRQGSIWLEALATQARIMVGDAEGLSDGTMAGARAKWGLKAD